MFDFLFSAIVIGAGGTALLDVWNLVLHRTRGLPLPPWHLVGRWFAGMRRGVFVHTRGISQSPPVDNELRIGWVMHYVVGIVFAMALLLLWGTHWAHAPRFFPALVVGLVTVGAGWFILQPGMGVGIACSRAANPAQARWLNVAGHVVFALGMYLSAKVFL
ncbi:DUF2938 family protein [Pseudomonas sp. NPDC007930]|uniref:DUF2938 domain-containing protein n=1 Tax=Pseudomonas sp. NPDC007930 TaxID=3364417 RepID=UPI0036E62BC6